MCGICGYVGIDGEPELLSRMVERVAHRGPDDAGEFRDGNVGLGFRRLSIIDRDTGHQPLQNEDETLTLILNGEIYNHRELRRQLIDRGHRFRSFSDAEVLLHLYEERGPLAVHALQGMFAAALWDAPERRLVLWRDRLGIKPLYYARRDSRLLFASELKALLAWEGIEASLRPEAVLDYLSLRYVPGPKTLIEGIMKLPAGHLAVVEGDTFKVTRYWAPPLVESPPLRSDADWLAEFGSRLETSVERRLMAEVPLGAYLSGGVDSSTLVASLSRRLSHPVRTFSVGFGGENDELALAAETARRLGCEHTEVRVGPKDLAALPRIVWHLDEPVGDPIVIPMYRLAEEASRRVTVVLSGEGADEILGGYLFFGVLLRSLAWTRRVPGWALRYGAAPAIRMTPSRLLDRFFDYPAALGRRGRSKVADFAGLLGRGDLTALWRHLISLFDARDLPGLLGPRLREAKIPDAPEPSFGASVPPLNRLIDLQFAHWLPDDILMKQDKLSMAHAIEARVPFLDHELVEFAMTVPPNLKVQGRHSKVLLRRYAQSILPEETAKRSKVPFYAPLERFVGANSFRELVEDTLAESRLRDRGLFDPRGVRRLVHRMESGEFLFVKQVFSLVSLELWCRAFLDRRGAP